jgi:hypothetical protein
VAFPDDGGDRGAIWPWALVALAWRIDTAWDAAVAVEALSSPELAHSFNALARLSRRLEMP